MVSRGTVLVVVPDHELRRSVNYLLQAEGLDVLAHEHLATAMPVKGTFHCAVIDEDAIEAHDSGWRVLAEIAEPVVVLWNRLRNLPENVAATFLDKPLLGQRVVDAVLAGLDLEPAPPST